ncbi:MAG: phosphatidylglycerophosphatase A family protein [Desulfomonilaceae bacterium]
MNEFVEKTKEAICTGFWFGHSPVAPGTAGTIPAIFIYALIRIFLGPEFQRVAVLGFLVASCLGCIAWGEWAEVRSGKKDPSTFVLDEIAGFFLTVLFFSTPSGILTIFWAFMATRIFDIIKPFPANAIQDAHGGWGILLDDLFASVYAIIFLRLFAWIFPGLTGF